MYVSFHVWDECNLRCDNCHWFSEKVTPNFGLPHEDYIAWILKFKPKQIRITGGEPLLYPEIIDLINKIPKNISIDLFTNGTLIQEIDIEDKRNLNLFIGLNRPVDETFLEFFKTKYTNIKFLSFQGRVNCVVLKNQMKEAVRFEKYLGKVVDCIPKMIRFGTDGNAYCCENGLRNKSKELRMPFSIYGGVPIIPKTHICQIKHSCLSNLTYEQEMMR